MSFKDRHRQASFRGVPFFVDKRDRTGGRRGPTHEHAQRDLPDAEDTGARARGFMVNAYIVGSDYDILRDRLLSALEKPGPGIYVDAWGLGDQRVIVRRHRMTETDDRRGLAVFSIEFEEAGDPAFPVTSQQTDVAVGAAAAGFSDAAVADFDAVYEVDGYPQFIADDAGARAVELIDGLGGLVRDVPAGAGMSDVLSTVKTNVAGSVREGFAVALRDGLSRISDTALGRPAEGIDPKIAQAAFAGLQDYGAGWPPITETTATRRQQNANASALRGLVRKLAMSEEARAATRIAFESVDQAIELRGDVLGRLDSVASTAAAGFEDRTFQSASALRAAVAADITARSGGLPRRRQLNVNQAMPAVVLAHRLYGDATLAGDVTSRTAGFDHPMFSPPTVDYLG